MENPEGVVMEESEAEAGTEEEEAGVEKTFMITFMLKCGIKTVKSLMRFQYSFVKMSARTLMCFQLFPHF